MTDEKKIYTFWEKEGLFKSDTNSSKKTFSLLIPPPNLTGELHIGHAMQHSILDAVARFRRLQGFDVLLLPGVDHAGIAFENTFDRELKKKNLSKEKLGREKWLEFAWEFKEKTYNSVSQSFRFMGLSADWSKEVFSLDEKRKIAVFHQFKKYYEYGLIYRGPYIVQWCPKCNTAIEDLEMEYEEKKEKLYYVRYLIEGTKDEYIEIATTRPETIFADTAVAIYPNHPKYKKFAGEKVINPLTKKPIPVIEDRRVEKDFGTGALKVTPGHDILDYKIGKDHHLPIIGVIDKSGRMTGNVNGLNGLTVNEARKLSVETLQKNGVLSRVEGYKHSVAVCERCKSVVEPIISKEWFAKVDQLAKGAITIINADKIKFLPKNYKKILVDWLGDIHDWCISRSLWWGHRIPVWYCDQKDTGGRKLGFAKIVVDQVFAGKTRTYRLRNHNFNVGVRVAFENSSTGEIFGFGTIKNVEGTTVGELPLHDPRHGATYKKRSELITAFKRHHPDRKIVTSTKAFIYDYDFIPKHKTEECCGQVIVNFEEIDECPKCGCKNVRQDEQVLDTWFSSGLWPLSTLGWPDKTKEIDRYFPWDFEISAPEIKYLWIARMIMISNYITGKEPFKTMFFHGMLRDLEGRKFSKSLGNGIEPQYLIDKWGTDATRMALYSYSIPGRDGRVSKEILDERGKNFRNFATKIRNIARFVLELKPPDAGHSRPDRESDSRFRGNDKGAIEKVIIPKDDEWIMGKLAKTTKTVTKHLENIELHLAVEEIYEFIWHSFADKYIESTKERRADAQPTLENILKQVLILLHPFMPFLTEELYQKFEDKQKSILLEKWPSVTNA